MMSLHSLTSLGMALELKDTETSSYMMALNDLEVEEADITLAREANTQQIDTLLHNTNTAVSELEAVKRLLDACSEEVQVQQSTTEAQEANMPYLNSKSQEYLESVTRLKVSKLSTATRWHDAMHRSIAEHVKWHTVNAGECGKQRHDTRDLSFDLDGVAESLAKYPATNGTDTRPTVKLSESAIGM
jgi:hypothetical protein